jgi:quercetin dioxygenase-like cupin family protein
MTEADPHAIHLSPGEGDVVVNPLGGPLTFKLRGEQTNGLLAAFESTAGPGEGPPLHIHRNEDEIVYVLEGTLRVKLGGELRPAPAGSFTYIPRGTAHTWQSVGATPARLLIVFTPGAFVSFFEQFAQQPAGSSPEEQFRALGREAGMDVVGPPLALSDPL